MVYSVKCYRLPTLELSGFIFCLLDFLQEKLLSLSSVILIEATPANLFFLKQICITVDRVFIKMISGLKLREINLCDLSATYQRQYLQRMKCQRMFLLEMKNVFILWVGRGEKKQ